MQIAIHILNFRDGQELLFHKGCKREQVLQVVALQRVLKLRIAGTSAYLNVLLRLHEERRSRNARHLGSQPIDDVENARLTLG